MTANRLATETSPYLIQHKDNPVHWMAWGDEALARARAEDKPILLSIGYAACHWCHVMAHESFEDEDIAALMNAHFVNIKVDREERPDVDTIYQTALALLGEHGGWPLTMFLSPDGKPFWGGTYFPPEQRHGRPGFPDVLRQIAQIYHDDRSRVLQNTDALVKGLQRLGQSQNGAIPNLPVVDRIARAQIRDIDPVLGGLQGAPKFPHAALFALMWRSFLRNGGDDLRNAVLVSCDRMCQGGIYDHVGGGFARYSTDAMWLVPHFEKMLYDNAQLVDLLTLVWQHTGTPLFRERTAETLEWVRREMIGEGGAFAASLDADSEGEEGKFYVWSPAEVEQVLGSDAGFFMQVYDVNPGGNWEGKTILHRLRVPHLDDPADEARLTPMRAKLLEARAVRPRPGWDDKILADWNGMMIAAMANAGAVFKNPAWTQAAETAFRFIASTLSKNGHLHHSYRAGKLGVDGMLDDYANMARAGIILFELTSDQSALELAKSWVENLNNRFWDSESGGYFTNPSDGESLLVRAKPGHDSAVPNGNAVMLEVLGRLYAVTGDASYRERADALTQAFAGQFESTGMASATWLNNLELYLAQQQIVIVGAADDSDTDTLRQTVLKMCLPNRILMHLSPDEALPSGHPAAGKTMIDGKPTAYICHGQTCSLPITDPDGLKAALIPSTL